MIQKRPKDFVEFHEGEKEFCPESGPLKSKKISAPSAAIAALVTSIATAATVYTLVVAPVFAFIPELISVVANVAKIETRIENLPEEASVVYNLSFEETPKEIVLSGEIYKSKDQLEFSNLKYDTDYVVKFYLKENKSKEFLKEIKFRTGKEVIDNPQDPIVPEQPEIPVEPEIPEQPVVPTPPIKPETPEQPIVPNPPVEPEVPDEPETPVTKITVVDADYDGAQAYMNNDTFAGYIMQETHIFENVPSNEYTIQITQDGEITTYNDVYDESTQTVTVSFSGNAISFGETSMSNVVLIYKDGASATSTNSVQTPKLETVTLDVVDNLDGTFTYTVNGNGIDPSVGSVETRITLHTDINEVSQNPVVQTFNKDAVTFEQEYTSEVYAPGETMTAVAFVEMAWSMDTSYSQTKEANKEYSILSAPEVVESTIDGAEAVINNDEVVGYIVEETHVFGNVPSDEYEIKINQGQITNYTAVYDEETQTATITVKGNTIGLGKTGTSEVVLTYKDGVSATSTNSVQTPKLETVTLDVVDNQDGTFTYTVNGEGVDPSVGTITLEMNVYSDYYELSNNPEVQTKVVNSMTFNDVFESSPIAQGKTLTALVQASAIWSLDETNTAQVKEANKEYSILSAPEVVESTIDGAEAVINNDEVVGYVVEETHVFGNVPSDEYEIKINQGQITNYTAVYDEETQTATITFKGNTIGLGETGTSEVVLTYKDGVSATSTNSVQTPKLETVTLDVVDNQDGSYTYAMNGTGINPSVGTVEVNVLALNDLNNQSSNPVTQTYTMNSANFTQAFTSHVDVYGETLTAVVEVELIWSLDEIGIGQFMMDSVDYRINGISELTFTDVTNVDGYAFSYTVNAKFANLLNATPVSMDMYIQTYNTLFNEVYEEELATTLDTSQIVKDDNGNITASYISDYLLGSEQDGHKWRIVLTYVDATNTTQTMEITNHIEPFDPVFNHLNSIMWQENGITYAEYEQVFSLSPTLTLKDVALVDADVSGWDVLSSEVEITDGFGYIRGLMSTDTQNGLELHAYLDWLATEYEEMIYTGCAGAGYMESSRTNQQLVPNSTNTGYDEVIEEFTFVDGTSMLDDFGQQHVLVTLADGSQIKVTQTEADATGTVTVNWNDNNNIVVTVHQANVAIGQSTVVDFVYEMVRDEPEMMGEVNHYTYRCFSNYE